MGTQQAVIGEYNYTWKDKVRAIGPGAVVTAGFMGPGTITTCTVAGASFGYALLWTVLFATIATIILQGMAARLGIITKEGLGEAIVKYSGSPLIGKASALLVGASITIGGMAYISGDLTGSAMGLSTITGIERRYIAPVIGCCVLALVCKGSYAILEKVLMTLLSVMGFVFLTTMILAKPPIGEIFQGFIPSLPQGSLLLAIALIGTTIVPYNFFIHATSARLRWSHPAQLELSHWDLCLAIGLGGLITAAIMITSGTLMLGHVVESAADLSIQLEPLLGSAAKFFLSIGLFCAGMSVAIATPLGVSYTLAGLFGWEYNVNDKRFKMANAAVLMVGIVISALGLKPISLILVAQVVNGIILPVVVVFLVVITSSRKMLGEFANDPLQKALGCGIALITIGLGGSSLFSVIRSFFS